MASDTSDEPSESPSVASTAPSTAADSPKEGGQVRADYPPSASGYTSTDTAPALIDSIVVGAAAVEQWVARVLAERDPASPGLPDAPAVTVELWLPVGRADAVAQAIATLDKSWRLATLLVEAAERGSSPTWPLEELLEDSSAALYFVAAERGSFSAKFRTALNSKQVKTALVVGGLLQIPVLPAQYADLILPDAPSQRCPVVVQAPPEFARQDVSIVIGPSPPGTVSTTNVDLGGGRKLVISTSSRRVQQQTLSTSSRTVQQTVSSDRPG